MLRRVGLITAICILGLLLTACERQKISDITTDPGRFNGKDVTVAGKVTSLSVGAINMGLYEIDDGTGKLVVISETRGAPAQGATVGVKGRIVPTFTFMGKSFVTVLRESDRKPVSP
jgi:DNA/RNA endonuclease YhcR with UshA esterase domain